jgi:hypothetical protein
MVAVVGVLLVGKKNRGKSDESLVHRSAEEGRNEARTKSGAAARNLHT